MFCGITFKKLPASIDWVQVHLKYYVDLGDHQQTEARYNSNNWVLEVFLAVSSSGDLIKIYFCRSRHVTPPEVCGENKLWTEPQFPIISRKRKIECFRSTKSLKRGEIMSGVFVSVIDWGSASPPLWGHCHKTKRIYWVATNPSDIESFLTESLEAEIWDGVCREREHW